MAFRIPAEYQLDQIIPLKEAAKLSGLSPGSWRRNFPTKIIRLGPRRIGVRLRDALLLGETGKEGPR
jgi:hypothetical protein